MKIEDALRTESEIRLNPTGRESALLHIIDKYRAADPNQEKYNYKQVLEHYKTWLPMGRAVELLTPLRKRRLVLRWQTFQKLRPADKQQTFEEFWEAVFKRASSSAFLTGKAPGRDFKPHLDFFLQESSLLKLREGVYHVTITPYVSRKESQDKAHEKFLESLQ